MKAAFRLIAISAILVTAPASAKDKDEAARPKVYLDVVACRDIADAGQRLACFDSAAAQLEQAADSKELVLLDRAEVKKARKSLFGFILPKLPFFDDEEGEEKFTQIDSTFASVSEFGYGKWQFDIPDGGTWQTTESTKNPLRVGQKVTIKQGAVGGYMMKVGGGGLVRVKRVN